MHSGDLLISAAVLLSGNNFQKIQLLANILKMPLGSSTTFHKILRAYLIPVVDVFWVQHQAEILMNIKENIHKNKLVRQDWCLNALDKKETFQNVIFTDETSVEIGSDGRLFFHKPNSALQCHPAKRPKPKHSYKDNDSKHTSKSTNKWMEENDIMNNVMETPASSPDLNPIENVWSTFKNYLETVVKPKKKAELIAGIRKFWLNLSATACGKYIDHIHRVIPNVVLDEGAPSGF
ncbi:Hypothetical predicted protein [Mytilus galloprovincialis]|uniref:Tc1-like transposase DDE domain-containing protein n=1 Tax=Mytilus galloprovincialis TaxID=29158 RepID=A0A8B6DW26_MYTGA|nr:Hypothetical predicted protein [Mytilus galloprovincialis]